MIDCIKCSKQLISAILKLMVAGPVLGPIQCNFTSASVNWFARLKSKNCIFTFGV